MDEDYDPSKPNKKASDEFADDYGNDGYSDMDNNSEDSDDEDEMRHVERNFNFVAELVILIDYTVVTKYCMILKDKDYMKHPALLQ
jgi:hypothetical protein